MELASSPRAARTSMTTLPPPRTVKTLGRYALFDEIAAGGMATVHLGRLLGPVGFSRTVAIKRLHSHFAKDPDFAAGFVDEARLAARIHHPNVVSIIDVLSEEGELSLVMDYVEGDSLAKLLRQSSTLGEDVPLHVVSAIGCGSLYGLHAAHEAVDEQGQPMHIVHRDISPQNILVGSDGVPRIVDFGVAKAAQRLQTTAEGQIKGKLSYMAPEQIQLETVGRQSDIYSIGVVLWECIARRRLFKSDNPANLMRQVLEAPISPPSAFRPECPPELDAVVMKALSREPGERFATARAMAQELGRAVAPAPPTDVSDWVQSIALDGLTARRKVRARIEAIDLDAGESRLEAPNAGVDPEDLPTLAQRPSFDGSPSSAPGSAPGSTLKPVRSRGKLWIPLVAGLLAIVMAISLVLFINRPQVDPLEGAEAEELKPPASSVEAATPSLPPDSAPSAPTPADAPASPSSPSAGLAPKQPGSEAEPPRPTPTSPAPTIQRPAAPCPKFIEEDGIRRVNRKCW